MATSSLRSPAPSRAVRASQRGKLRDADATREAILKAAMQEISQKGLHGARVEEIVARTETSKQMVYYYFGSKDGLYAAVLKRAYQDFRQAEAAIDYMALPPIKALRALIAQTYDAHTLHPHVVRILMSENMDTGRHITQVDNAAQRRLVLETLRAIFERGQAEGVLRTDLNLVQFHMSVSALSAFFVSNRYTFSAVFELPMDTEEARLRRRDEVIETMMARAVVPSAAASGA